MQKFFNVTLVLAAIVAQAALAADPIDFSAKGARVYKAENGGSLSGPSKALQTAFLSARDRAAGMLVVTSENRTRGGLTHLRLKQEVAGLPVYGTYVKATVNARGELVHLIENLAVLPADGLEPAIVGPGDALDAVIEMRYPGRKAKGFFYRQPSATPVAIAMDDGSMQEGYLVETWTRRTNMLHHTLVGGDGRVLNVQLRTYNDSYNVFSEEPDSTPQQVVNGPGAGNVESPAGWLFGSGQTTIDISGNNVHAYLDRNADDAPDGGGSAVNDGNFLTSANLSQDPETAANQAVAVQNLFYFNNVIHDKLYRHGFTESAGNFQEDNFGQGGLGGDSVYAEAQDGLGTNNANFSNPADGTNPRMQMYLWTYSSPERDGDLDSDIIWHEYGHGLSWRMVGDMSGTMSAAIGEGFSDMLAIYINRDDVVGEYASNDPLGVRSAPYTNYGRTYGDFHNGGSYDGEIYAATMWKLLELWEDAGFTLDELFDHVVGGLNFTPSQPAFEHMRDGILAASPTQEKDCIVWDAFAQFGIGVGAQAKIKGNGNVNVTESFDLPIECSGCTITENPEISCSDQQDNDCDGLTDGDDPDCGGGSCSPIGASCSTDGDCCSGNCSNGPPSSRVCQ